MAQGRDSLGRFTGGPSVTLTFKGDTDDLQRSISGIGTMVAGLGATVGILGGIGAAAAAVVLGVAAVPAAFLGIGIAAAAQSEAVKARFTEMKDHVIASVTALARPIEAELLRSADAIQAGYDRIAPSLGRIFELAAPHLKIFTDGLIALIERAMPGFEAAVRNGTPIVEAFGRGLGLIGEGIGKFFANLTEGSPGAVLALDALFGLTRDLLDWLGRLIGQLANALGPAFAASTGPIMDIVKAMGEFLVPVVEALAPLIGSVAGVMRDILVPMFKALGKPIADVVAALVEQLVPILKEVGEWFEKNADQIADIAEQLGTFLVEAIRVVGPFLGELVRLALKLADALLPIIPPLIEIARNLLPVLDKVLRDLVIPALQWLVDMLIKYVIPEIKRWVDKTAEASRQFSAIYDGIKAAFRTMIDAIKAGIDTWVGLGETARRHWDAMFQVIKGKAEEIIRAAVDMPRRIIEGIMGWFTRMYDAGAGLMQRFADGINSKATAAQDAAGNVVGGTAALFPQSPAKTGPFSGQGYTLYRGQKLIEDFGRGITDAAPRLADLARQAMEGARIALSPGFGTGQGGTVNASGGFGSMQLSVAPGVDSALSSLLMNLVRAGQLQLQRVV